MAQLAIRGHETRGEEVIKLLEMMGGVNTERFKGEKTELGYYIECDYSIHLIDIKFDYRDVFYKITLEEFEEKYTYKVGDKVKWSKDNKVWKIECIKWDEYKDQILYALYRNDRFANAYVNELQPYEEETMEKRKYTDLRLDVDQDDKLATEATIDGNKIIPPENHLIGKITRVDNGMLVEFVKKQPVYPKTQGECCEVLFPHSIALGKVLTSGYNCELLKKFGELLICRDAYWKIAGKQMVLDKPWEPDWSNATQRKYCIVTTEGNVLKWVQKTTNKILAFPTAEMRDFFYENFKELIEECKELL